MATAPQHSWGPALDPLVVEFATWTEAQGLFGQGDALELLMGDLTPAQRQWVSDFILRWEEAEADHGHVV